MQSRYSTNESCLLQSREDIVQVDEKCIAKPAVITEKMCLKMHAHMLDLKAQIISKSSLGAVFLSDPSYF